MCTAPLRIQSGAGRSVPPRPSSGSGRYGSIQSGAECPDRSRRFDLLCRGEGALPGPLSVCCRACVPHGLHFQGTHKPNRCVGQAYVSPRSVRHAGLKCGSGSCEQTMHQLRGGRGLGMGWGAWEGAGLPGPSSGCCCRTYI